ncbi:hypothetical protein OIU77_027870 [Salix suchowensis]|uniref:Solute carrier family 35 member F2 n=1 Tax=Salix suchowensis TaxID=1278906 RepID=A0ABQ9BSU0_9ROSI|nr:hypothetical protein OIU77_027870 [Salix suchowensis]
MSFWFNIDRWWRSHGNLRTLYLLLLGQMVSFVLAMGSFTSSLVSSLGVDAPLTQSSFNYLALALVYGSILLCRRQKLQISWYWYLLLGLVDVQGNYLVNKAYQYSSITSVTLLDCWTVAWVIALTWFFLRTRYSLWQLLGAAICVLGLGLVLLSDAGVGGGGGSRPILGDFLVIAGTIFFALSNVGEELCVKKKDRVEVVAMLGVYGFLVSAVELSIVELKTLEATLLAIGGLHCVDVFILLSCSHRSKVKWSNHVQPCLFSHPICGLLFSVYFSTTNRLIGYTSSLLQL